MLGNGEFLRREGEYRAAAALRRKKAAAERAKVAAMSAAQKKRYLAKQAAQKAALQETVYWRQEWNKGVEAGRNLGAQLLSPKGKILRDLIVRRDWDGLFKLFPVAPNSDGPGTWQKHWSISKYSFTGDGANKRYVAWTESDIRRWIFSPYYTVAPGHECSDAQRETGIQAYMKAQNRHKQKFGPNLYHYVWPIYPGRGYGDQTYGCQRDKDSWWVKNRKVVVSAVAVVAAIYLGPIVLSKIGGGAVAETGGAAAGAAGTGAGTTAATGIVGAGTKAGVVSAVTTKAGAGIALTKTAAGTVATIKGAASAGSLFTKVQTATTWVNRARSVDAIIKGELPPPPIGISGSNFTEWAVDLAKKEIVDEAKEAVGGYLSKKAQEKIEKENEARIRAEIARMQAELAELTKGAPIAPTPELADDVRERIIAMQDIERKREQQNAVLLAAGAGALLLMAG